MAEEEVPDQILLLDENLCYCGRDFEQSFVDAVKLELKKQGYYAISVGDRNPSPKLLEKLQRGSFKEEVDMYPRAFKDGMDRTIGFCLQEWERDTMREGITAAAKHSFKDCVNTKLEAGLQATKAYKSVTPTVAKVPIRRAADADIRDWVRLNKERGQVSILIVSRDVGAGLEPKEFSDRIAIRTDVRRECDPRSPEPAARKLANSIVERLRQVNRLTAPQPLETSSSEDA